MDGKSGTETGKGCRGKSGSEREKFFSRTEMGKTIFPFPSMPIGATLTGHHVSPCEERVLC